MQQTFPISPIAANTLWWLVLIIAVLLAVSGFILTKRAQQPVIATSVLIVMLAITVLFGWFLLGAFHAKVKLDQYVLMLDAPLYGRSIPAASLITQQARAIDLRNEQTLWPRVRTNGLGLPGYLLGWFTLRDGDKALLAVTDTSSVVYLPTSEGYVILFSTPDTERFIRKLQ